MCYEIKQLCTSGGLLNLFGEPPDKTDPTMHTHSATSIDYIKSFACVCMTEREMRARVFSKQSLPQSFQPCNPSWLSRVVNGAAVECVC